MDKDEVETILRALIASNKGGIPIDELNTEFYRQTMRDIPFLSLGFSSMYDFMRHVKQISTHRNKNGNVVYILKDNINLRHIVNLVEKQKDPITRHNNAKPLERRTKMKKTVNRRIPKTRNHSGAEYSTGDDSDALSDSYEEVRGPIKICSPPKNINIVHTPLCHGNQLIGDDFFLQLAIRNLKRPIWRKQHLGPLQCGLCISGLTVRGAIKKLQTVESLSNKVTIMLGAEDIYRGRSGDDIADDLEDLIKILQTRFSFSNNAINICTIPPLANIGIYNYTNTIVNIHAYNNAIRQLSIQKHCGLIDFFNNYTNPNYDVIYDYFQIDARMVSGSSHPYVLFNKRGRRLAVNLLKCFS
ncbi:hypothetical protein PV325_003867 [Microctonus aethiopoides]|uniref:HTH OST-type domain-containing protein n=1 Tax=Microctonus aethiopoides TaxID=144406 RepID=A0AA39KRK2_9HYME|nr:hypothetical protein PV325_003867 [Microctonus aethiopoides]KAK0171235.1 hypothetical protein PV328_008986 [Microctonus aethiopoides]